MTDRYYGLAVILEDGVTDADAEGLMNFFKCIRHVVDVQLIVTTADVYSARWKSNAELRHEIMDMLNPLKNEQ